MKRPSSGRKTDRRKKPRKTKALGSSVSSAPTKGETKSIVSKAMPGIAEENCRHCANRLTTDDRALFVEEEIGRIFCSEACIAAFFAPDIERLEKEYLRRVVTSDLSGEEREKYAHLRWVTLQDPDEVWREKTLSGDSRYTLISEFQPGNRKIWCVCICLFLRGEPSFLYLAFPTRNAAMVNHYRRGERVEWVRSIQEPGTVHADGDIKPMSDGLAGAWTEDETLRAQLTRDRASDDIPVDEFNLYQACLEETLEVPDEVWSVETGEDDSEPVVLYHFIRHYPEEKPGVWYVIIAREIPEEEQIEILDAFPTRDSRLVERFRTGNQEVGEKEEPVRVQRVVH